MSISVQMPALGESVTEGTVTRWLKQEGDAIERDEPLLEVSTDKADTEIPSPVAGVLTKILAHEDDTIEVGGELAIIGTSDGSPSESPSQPSGRDPEPRVAETQTTTTHLPAPSSSGSSTPVLMPELGESVTEGTVTRWLKAVGDSVVMDEPPVEVSTDKVDTEIPSPLSGTLLSITAEEDSSAAVGGELARIGEIPPISPIEPASRPSDRDDETPTPRSELAPKQSEPASTAAAPDASTASAPYVTPLVRKLAGENGVDLEKVRGTGVGGRIRKQDVLAAADAERPPAAAEDSHATVAAPVRSAPLAPAELAHWRGTTQKANRIRQITAQKTRESLQTTAQLTQTHEVDMTLIVALRAKTKANFAEQEGVNLTFLPFFAKAATDALKAHPNINASYNEDTKEITYHDAEHIGFAVDTEQGLLSPVVRNAGDLSLAGLARAIADIAARARSGKLKPDELAGGTFTITNFGTQGALFDTPILVPPQAAMLGTGAIVKRPRIVIDDNGNESIGVRSVCFLPLTYDHRLIDGADAGRFMTTVRRRLEEAAFDADLGL
jgi:2-oxoglutarate dehydrogenase E2 component (dihydrolipoamide succinyltransferase)